MNNIKFISFLGQTKNVNDETLLKSIHFKRLKTYFPSNFIKEIEKKYIKTNDVRFLNELLWICEGNLQKIPASIKKFNSHFKDGVYEHDYDQKFSKLKYKHVKLNQINFKNNSIALIGNPLFFIFLYFKLLKFGVRADIIHVKHHPNKFLNKIFNSFSFFYKFIFKKSYYKIDIDDKSQLHEFVMPKKYDIGFHKLSFIIKDNIISSFRKGLINDHWGALPFVKGRSTLLYSKLFGILPVITNHLIDKQIDAGKIINYYPLKKNNLKFQIIFGLTYRAFDSLNLLSQNKFKEIDNREGVVFYEMHHWLSNKL